MTPTESWSSFRDRMGHPPTFQDMIERYGSSRGVAEAFIEERVIEEEARWVVDRHVASIFSVELLKTINHKLNTVLERL